MSGPNSNESRRVLYLKQIDVDTTNAKFRVNVQIDNRDVEMRREQRTSIWTPVESLEFPDDSKITVVIKAGRTVKGFSFGKLEARAEASGQEAIKSFWDSIDSTSTKDSISHTTTFGQHPITVTFKFRPSQTSEDTRAAVSRLQKEMENFHALMTGTTEHFVDKALKLGVTLAELDPMSKLAIGLAKTIFDVFKEQRKYDDMASDLASAIDRIFPFAKRTLEEVLGGDADLLEAVVRRLFELIVEIATFICGYAKRGRAFRTLKSVILPEDQLKIKSLQDKFSLLEKDFDRAVGVETLTHARTIAGTVEMDHLLTLLKPVREANYQEDHRCMKGTRTAVLSKIIAWVNKPLGQDEASRSHADNVYWLYGIPGLGKTSVANSLCHQLHQNGNLGGSFFCKRDNTVLQDPKRVLPTLISKLAAMWSPYRTLIVQALRDDPQLNPESTNGELLLKSLRALKKPPPRTIVLVIDALDECGEDNTRERLLESLFEACSRAHWLKIVITSRPEQDIQSFFETQLCTNRDLAEDDQTGEDIRYFAQERMQSVAKSRKGWPGEARLSQIVERSHGLFIYVETVCLVLKPLKNPDKELDLLLGEKQQKANAELHNLYLTALKSQVGQEMEEFCRIARAIIAVATYRPLSDKTLASLIEEDSHVVQAWVDALGWIFYRERSQKGAIRIRHLSILEFLTGLSDPVELRVDLKLAHAELSLYCLRTMANELKFNICGLETSYKPNSDIENLDARVQQNIPDAVLYSCVHWPSHLCTDLDTPSMEVSELLNKFFTGEWPLYWLEVLSVTGNVPAAIVGMQIIKESHKKLEKQILLQAEELVRFVHAFFTPISTSAPHIYVSALPFMPLESNLWNHVHEAFPKLVNVYKGRMRRWPTPARIWQGHGDSVTCIAYSPNGLFVVSGSNDRTIRIWDATTGTAVGQPLSGHTSSIRGIAYSPNGHHIVSGSYDNTIRIWDATTGAAVGEPLTGHTDCVYSVAYSPNGHHIVSGSFDKTIRIWDATTGAAVGEPLTGHTDCVYSVAYSPNGHHIVSGSFDDTIRIWDATTGAAVGEPLSGHTSSIRGIAYSPNGDHIVSGSYDNTIRIWDATTGAAVGEPLTGHTDCVYSVAYSPNGHHIVSGSFDNTIRIWDATTGAAVGEPLTGHTDCVYSVAYSPNGHHIVSGSFDDTIRIWDATTGAAVGEPLSGHTGYVNSVAYSPNGHHIVSGSSDKTIRIWDATTGAAVGEPLSGHTSYVNSVAYSPNGHHIVSGSFDKTIRIWDATTGAAVGEPLSGDTGWVYSVAYSPNGHHIVSGSSDNTIRIWDATTGAAMGEPLSGHTGSVLSVAYSPNGHHIVSGSSDKTIRIWDATTGAAVGEPLSGHTSYVNSVAYSPNGHHIVSGSFDKTIRIWDATTGAAVGEPLTGHTDCVYSVAYSPNGHHIVSGSFDDTIRIWDATTGAAVGEPLSGHTSSIRGIAYSPNGDHIVSGSYDNTIRIWDATTGAAVGEPLTGHTDCVYSVAYSPNGHHIVSGSFDNTIRIWDATTGAAVGEALSGHTGSVFSVAYSPNGDRIVSGSSDNTIRISGAIVVPEDEDGITSGPQHLSNYLGNAGISVVSDPSPRAGPSGFAIVEGSMDSDGWVRSTDGLLLWIPEDCRYGLVSPAIMTIPADGRLRCVRLDFTHFRCGTSWTEVYGGL